jgi:hypothetical protein
MRGGNVVTDALSKASNTLKGLAANARSYIAPDTKENALNAPVEDLIRQNETEEVPAPVENATQNATENATQNAAENASESSAGSGLFSFFSSKPDVSKMKMDISSLTKSLREHAKTLVDSRHNISEEIEELRQTLEEVSDMINNGPVEESQSSSEGWNAPMFAESSSEMPSQDTYGQEMQQGPNVPVPEMQASDLSDSMSSSAMPAPPTESMSENAPTPDLFGSSYESSSSPSSGMAPPPELPPPPEMQSSEMAPPPELPPPEMQSSDMAPQSEMQSSDMAPPPELPPPEMLSSDMAPPPDLPSPSEPSGSPSGMPPEPSGSPSGVPPEPPRIPEEGLQLPDSMSTDLAYGAKRPQTAMSSMGGRFRKRTRRKRSRYLRS